MELPVAARVGLVGVGLAVLVGGTMALDATQSIEMSRAVDAPDPCEGVAEHIHRHDIEITCIPIRLPHPAAFVITHFDPLFEPRCREGLRVGVFDDGGLHPITSERVVEMRGCDQDWAPLMMDIDGDGIDELVLEQWCYDDHRWTVFAVRGAQLVESPTHSFQPQDGSTYDHDRLIRTSYARDVLRPLTTK